MFIAQQALSRDIAKLERELGVRVFDRSTRSVALTQDGDRLLPLAQEVLALADRLIAEARLGHRALVVDVVRYGSTAARVVERAQAAAGDSLFSTRFHGGVAAAFAALQAGRVDVAFGRPITMSTRETRQLVRRIVRFEPLGILLPDDHALASEAVIPTEAIKGLTIDTSAGNTDAAEWVELATELVEYFEGTPSPEHHPGMSAIAAGSTDDVARHVRHTGWPILTMVDVPVVSATVIVPLVDPVPVYPWVMTHRRELRHPGVPELGRSIDQLAAEHGWLDVPEGAWFASRDRRLAADQLG